MAMLDVKYPINLILDIIDDTRNELMYSLIDLLETWFLFIVSKFDPNKYNTIHDLGSY